MTYNTIPDRRLHSVSITVIPLQELCKTRDPETRVIILGDACMSPYELFSPNIFFYGRQQNSEPGLRYLQKLREQFKHSIWLNPLSNREWRHPTIKAISENFPMFELTLEGLEEGATILSHS